MTTYKSEDARYKDWLAAVGGLIPTRSYVTYAEFCSKNKIEEDLPMEEEILVPISKHVADELLEVYTKNKYISNSTVLYLSLQVQKVMPKKVMLEVDEATVRQLATAYPNTDLWNVSATNDALKDVVTQCRKWMMEN